MTVARHATASFAPANPRLFSNSTAAIGDSRMSCRPFVPRLWTKHDASEPGKRAESLVDSLGVWKKLSNIRIEKDHVGTLCISRRRDTPYGVRKVVLRAHGVGVGCGLLRLSRFHNFVSLGSWRVAH